MEERGEVSIPDVLDSAMSLALCSTRGQEGEGKMDKQGYGTQKRQKGPLAGRSVKGSELLLLAIDCRGTKNCPISRDCEFR